MINSEEAATTLQTSGQKVGKKRTRDNVDSLWNDLSHFENKYFFHFENLYFPFY
jgi:hypothetical protein